MDKFTEKLMRGDIKLNKIDENEANRKQFTSHSSAVTFLTESGMYFSHKTDNKEYWRNSDKKDRHNYPAIIEKVGPNDFSVITELSTGVLRNYVRKANTERYDSSQKSIYHKDSDVRGKHLRRYFNRHAGIEKAQKTLNNRISNPRYVREDVQLDELSSAVLTNYIGKSAYNATKHAEDNVKHDKEGDFDKGSISFDKKHRRLRGIRQAADRLTKEELEHLLEKTKYYQKVFRRSRMSDQRRKARSDLMHTDKLRKIVRPFRDSNKAMLAANRASEDRIGKPNRDKYFKKERAIRSEELDYVAEAVKVDHGQYIASTGKNPSGRGSWVFSKHKTIDFGSHKRGEDWIGHNGPYSQAKAVAKKWAATKNHSVIYTQS